MTTLTTPELQQAQQALSSNRETQAALAALTTHNGDLETSFAQLWSQQHPSQTFAPDQPDRSLLKSTLTVLRQEICGSEGFRGQLDEYRKNPGNAPLLTGLIGTLSGLAIANGIPLDTPLAAIVVLYVSKVGLAIICDYTKPV